MSASALGASAGTFGDIATRDEAHALVAAIALKVPTKSCRRVTKHRMSPPNARMRAGIPAMVSRLHGPRANSDPMSRRGDYPGARPRTGTVEKVIVALRRRAVPRLHEPLRC